MKKKNTAQHQNRVVRGGKQENPKKHNRLFFFFFSLRVERNPSDNKREPDDSSQLLTRCRNQGYPSGEKEEMGNDFGYYRQVLLLCGNIFWNYYKSVGVFSHNGSLGFVSR